MTVDTVDVVQSRGVVIIGESGGTVDIRSISSVGAVPYDGPYEVVPSGVAQVLGTDGKMMNGDLVVAPIPSNYGLVTWDGSVLTVS